MKTVEMKGRIKGDDLAKAIAISLYLYMIYFSLKASFARR